jgi:hypothetical protein
VKFLLLLLLLTACTSVTIVGTDNKVTVSNKPEIDTDKGVDDTTEGKKK